MSVRPRTPSFCRKRDVSEDREEFRTPVLTFRVSEGPSSEPRSSYPVRQDEVGLTEGVTPETSRSRTPGTQRHLLLFGTLHQCPRVLCTFQCPRVLVLVYTPKSVKIGIGVFGRVRVCPGLGSRRRMGVGSSLFPYKVPDPLTDRNILFPTQTLRSESPRLSVWVDEPLLYERDL